MKPRRENPPSPPSAAAPPEPAMPGGMYSSPVKQAAADADARKVGRYPGTVTMR
jgi:hypothetical protein